MSQERAYWFAWSQLNGVGPVLLKRIYQHFETLENAWKATPRALGEVQGLGAKLIQGIVEQRGSIDPASALAAHAQQNSCFWTPADPDYPQLLWEIPSPPPLLYYQGQVNRLENQGRVPGIGIVGTRYPTEHGQRWTKNLSRALAQHGFTVISGLAAGIDAMAHQSCLAALGRTIAVLGTGLDLIYPPQHCQLFEQILAKGLVVTEYPVGTKPERGNFPARNRIIAGLSRAVLVLEAPEKSGSLITARYASDFNRDVYTLPNSPEVEAARGCLKLIHNGAEVILSEQELLASLGAIPALDPPQPLSLLTPSAAPTPDLDPAMAQLLQAVPYQATLFDAIVAQAGQTAGAVSGGLLQLELLGLVMQLPGMRYQRR